MQGKYRDAQSLSEIESILNTMGAEDGVVWQNHWGERRVYDIESIEFLEMNKEVRLRVSGYNGDFDINESIYIKLQYRGTMFKSTIVSIDGRYLTIAFPLGNDMKTVELRSEPRISFDLSEDKLVTLKLAVESTNQVKTNHILKFKLTEISGSGFCLLVSNQNKEFLKKSENILITHLGEKQLKRPISLERMHIGDFRYKSFGKYISTNRAGFKLEKKFPKEELEEFIKSTF